MLSAFTDTSASFKVYFTGDPVLNMEILVILLSVPIFVSL